MEHSPFGHQKATLKHDEPQPEGFERLYYEVYDYLADNLHEARHRTAVLHDGDRAALMIRAAVLAEVLVVMEAQLEVLVVPSNALDTAATQR